MRIIGGRCVAYFDGMKQNDIITLQIRDVGMCGEGIASYEDYTVFVPFALPDERVEVKVDYVKRNLAYATLRRVLAPSASRVAVPCGKYGRCGGCDLMHADYGLQLEIKRKIVATALQKAKVDATVLPTVASPKRLGYRNKIALPFGMAEGRITVGFYREGTHQVVGIRQCVLHEAWAAALIEVTLRWAEQYRLQVYDSATGKGLLRHLVARHLGNHTDVTMVINADNLPFWRQYAAALGEVLPEYSLYISTNTRRNNVIMGDRVRLVAGEPYSHTIEGVSVEVNPLSFLQVNDDVCAAIYRRVREVIEPRAGKIVVDAFAGIGTLGATLAKDGADVYNIEIVPEAIEDADRLYRKNGLAGHNLCGDSAVLLPEVLRKVGQKAPAVHEMHLRRPYFEAMCAGHKRYELRLADEKRSRIALGDLIRFDCEGEALYCRVTSTAVFPDFAALFAAIGTADTVDSACTALPAAASMDEFYTSEMIERYGAMAIGVEPINIVGIYVVLDPPRKGCPEAVVQSLVSLGKEPSADFVKQNAAWPVVTMPYVQQVVYISCNPATLARDLAILQSVYRVASVQPYDMFPQTRHVETLCLLRKQ